MGLSDSIAQRRIFSLSVSLAVAVGILAYFLSAGNYLAIGISAGVTFLVGLFVFDFLFKYLEEMALAGSAPWDREETDITQKFHLSAMLIASITAGVTYAITLSIFFAMLALIGMYLVLLTSLSRLETWSSMTYMIAKPPNFVDQRHMYHGQSEYFEPDMPRKNYCPKCHAEVAPDKRECPKCHANFRQDEAREDEKLE